MDAARGGLASGGNDARGKRARKGRGVVTPELGDNPLVLPKRRAMGVDAVAATALSAEVT